MKRQGVVVTHTRDLLNRAPEILKTLSSNVSLNVTSLSTSAFGKTNSREISGSMKGTEGVSFPPSSTEDTLSTFSNTQTADVSTLALAAGITSSKSNNDSTKSLQSTTISMSKVNHVTPIAPVVTSISQSVIASVPPSSSSSSSSTSTSSLKHTPLLSEKPLQSLSSLPIVSSSSSSSSTNSKANQKRVFREVAVPSSQLERVWGFGSLAAKLLIGAAGERVSKFMKGNEESSTEKVISKTTAEKLIEPKTSNISISSTSTHSSTSVQRPTIPSVKPAINISEAQAERLAEGLCRMRGAALKIGQMLSLSDDTMIPPQIAKALERVRTQADVMPKRQFDKVMTNEFGNDWREKFGGINFEDAPVAAASIGQVHRTVLPDGRMCAVKVQYPGVAESITSDINNLKTLLSIGNFLPAGLYIDSVMAVAREELAAECDYLREAAAQERFRANVGSDPDFEVAEVVRSHSTARVLTTTWVKGMPIDQVSVTERGLPQSVRDGVARKLLKLTLNELFTWRFMQTDPNWGNFLYDPEKDVIGLLDFGASRHFKKAFVDDYLRLVWAAANKDTKTITDVSIRLGFLTGLESKAMLHAHVESGLVVGEPFLTNEPFDFHGSGITQRVSQYGEVFAHERLTPPPTEVYSLHRKLAGAFLICIRMGAKMKCRDLLEEVYFNHKFGPVSEDDDKSGLAIAVKT